MTEGPGSVAVVRVYDEPGEGYRVLVDRLWPRGVRKAAAALDEWAVDAAPSADLRRWYGHDPDRFDEFRRRYLAELAEPPAAEVVSRLLAVSREQALVLVTATKDVPHSGARVLHDHLRARSPERRSFDKASCF